MTQDEGRKASPDAGRDRTARLGEALRSNLSRRREQARARRATLMDDDDAANAGEINDEEATE